MASQVVIGWTETYVKCLDCISTIDVKHEALYRQRHRYESTLFMRSLDPNPQAGPSLKREDYKPSANALVSLQRDQGKGVPQNSVTSEDKTAQHIGSYCPTTLGMVEFQLTPAFPVIFIFDMDRKLNMVELSTLERFSTVERVATRRMATSTVVGQMVRKDSDRFMFRLAQENLLRANTVSTVAKVDLSSNSLCSLAHSSCSFFSHRLRVQTVATAMNATGGVQITPHRTHARAHFSRYVPHFAQFIQCTKVFERSFACFSKVIPSATRSLLGVPEFTSFRLCFGYYDTDTTDWNQTKPVRDSAPGWTVWSSGRSDSKHRL